jgi:hypothetical protein
MPGGSVRVVSRISGDNSSSAAYFSAVAKRPGRVQGVRRDKQNRNCNPQRARHPDPEQHGDEEGADEERKIALERRKVHAECEALGTPPAVEKGRDSDQRHRDRCQQQRRAEDRSDGDVFRSALSADDRDDRD